MKVFVLKVYEAEVENEYANLADDDLKLISHQEFNLKHNSPRHIQILMANWARYFNERRNNGT